MILAIASAPGSLGGVGDHDLSVQGGGTDTKEVVSSEGRTASHIVFRDVVKCYGAVRVISQFNAHFERHATMAILGRSGSGKTTIGRLIAALTPVTSGSLCIGGVELSSMRERELMRLRIRFGVVFQQHALLDSMNVLDNIAFPLREHHPEVAKSDVEARVASMLAELGLFDKERRRPSELSGGERKRVAIARALILNPELVVYDEPTTGLDPEAARAVDDLIIGTQAKHGVTSVVITHDVATCYRVANRVLLVEAGRVVAEGSPHELAFGENELARSFFSQSGVTEKNLALIARA